MVRRGAEFEEAVRALAEALNPSAEILFNHKVPDRDTGSLRQCDVWINARIGKHWPVSVLVSCKDHARKLHVGDVGAFCNEVHSTGASTGVIYSRSGFTGPALDKGRANGIACCRLYRREQADIPDAVWFTMYACNQQMRLELLSDLRGTGLDKWQDVFDLGCRGAGPTVIDAIANRFVESGDEVVRKHAAAKVPGFPSDWVADLRLELDGPPNCLHVRILGHWRRFRARLEATLLEGSYCLTNRAFAGRQVGPSVAIREEHPGEAWEEMMDGAFALPQNSAIHILSHPSIEGIKDTLCTGLGPSRLPGL